MQPFLMKILYVAQLIIILANLSDCKVSKKIYNLGKFGVASDIITVGVLRENVSSVHVYNRSFHTPTQI